MLDMGVYPLNAARYAAGLEPISVFRPSFYDPARDIQRSRGNHGLLILSSPVALPLPVRPVLEEEWVT